MIRGRRAPLLGRGAARRRGVAGVAPRGCPAAADGLAAAPAVALGAGLRLRVRVAALGLAGRPAAVLAGAAACRWAFFIAVFFTGAFLTVAFFTAVALLVVAARVRVAEGGLFTAGLREADRAGVVPVRLAGFAALPRTAGFAAVPEAGLCRDAPRVTARAGADVFTPVEGLRFAAAVLAAWVRDLAAGPRLLAALDIPTPLRNLRMIPEYASPFKSSVCDAALGLGLRRSRRAATPACVRPR
jgi:hypothetical protein